MENIDMQRARYAYEEVRAVAPRTPREAKDFRNELHSAATLVQQLGLAQTLAFYAATGKEDRRLVRRQLLGWLAESPVTLTLFAGTDGPDPQQAAEERYRKLLKLGSHEQMFATDEALAVLLWMKRFADGRWDRDGTEVVQLAEGW